MRIDASNKDASRVGFFGNERHIKDVRQRFTITLVPNGNFF